ncbi:ABC transporter ATP-binding protein [Paenalcaligenes hominis]|uniref:ABC transporter ATP-binding protein n=1 Tax=Paenalcaligenes hominis TaxID=643674 RepID=UPI003523833E
MLKIQDLSLSIAGTERYAVRHLSLQIERGQTFALVGESGSGKSMTALAIMRLLPDALSVKSGTVEFQGTNLFSLSEAQMRSVRGNKIAMIFQEPATCLNPVLRIGDQLIESMRLHTHYKKAELQQRAIAWLDKVGIPDPVQRINDYPFQFSGGQRQRIMIAMALAVEPDVLIADEPTTALDVTVQAQILELLKTMQQDLGLTVLLITHDLAVVQQMADQVALLRQGEVVFQSTAAAFFKQPDHPYARHLLDVIPSFARREHKYGNTSSEALPPNATPLLQVQHLEVGYKQKRQLFKATPVVPIVKDLSFDLHEGETLALLGASGCGKSTVAKALLRIIDEQIHVNGQALLRGEDLLHSRGAQLAQQRRKIQIVFQDPFASLNPRMMVGDILAEGLKSLQPHWSEAQRQKRISELLDLTAMPADSTKRYAHEFSGGQRQRIAIARALAVEPQVLICDEPTSALDVSVQAQILDLLIQLQKDTGLAYLFITHNFSVVEYLADRVAVMDQGKIVEMGTAQQVLLRPQQSITQQLLHSVPRLSLETTK